MSCTVRSIVLLMASFLGAASANAAQPASVSPEGIGQVLIYPYYTVRNGWSTLLSIVNNDLANGKAVKLRFLEGKNGAVVASANVFLAPNDMWTAAVLPGGANGAPQLVSNDESCTYPLLRVAKTATGQTTQPTLSFDTKAIVADGDAIALQTIDRLREGYFEAIEMASVPFNRSGSPSLLQLQIGTTQPPGRLNKPACAAISDAELVGYSNDVTPASGGLSGAATLVNVLEGASAEYSPVALSTVSKSLG